MKKITTDSGLQAVFHNDNPMPSGVINTSGYGNLGFECGCGKSHGVNDYSIQQIANFRPVKILFKCDTHYTKVSIKEIFSQTCVSEATFTVAFMDKLTREKGLK